MYIYRMEHKEHRCGPIHRGGLTLTHFNGRSNLSTRQFPVPWDDNGIGLRKGEQCACASLEQLRHWFPEEDDKKLHKAGYVCLRLRIDKRAVRVGKYQVVYNPEKVSTVKTLPLCI